MNMKMHVTLTSLTTYNINVSVFSIDTARVFVLAH